MITIGLQFRRRLLVSILSCKSGPGAAVLTLRLQPCQQWVSKAESQGSIQFHRKNKRRENVNLRRRRCYSGLNCGSVSVSSPQDGRQFPSKPLRESQSRLLTTTPSWTDSETTTDKDRKGDVKKKIYIIKRQINILRINN